MPCGCDLLLPIYCICCCYLVLPSVLWVVCSPDPLLFTASAITAPYNSQCQCCLLLLSLFHSPVTLLCCATTWAILTSLHCCCWLIVAMCFIFPLICLSAMQLICQGWVTPCRTMPWCCPVFTAASCFFSSLQLHSNHSQHCTNVVLMLMLHCILAPVISHGCCWVPMLTSHMFFLIFFLLSAATAVTTHWTALWCHQ